jgi:hypothetical protein
MPAISDPGISFPDPRKIFFLTTIMEMLYSIVDLY